MKFKNVFNFWNKNKNIIKYILLLFIISRVALTLAGTYSKTTYKHKNPDSFAWSFSENKLLDVWGIWDSGYYLDIANRGYSYDQNFTFPVKIDESAYSKNQINFHFFPLYPLLIKSINLVVGNYYNSGIIFSNFSLFLSCFFLYKLLRLDYGEKISTNAVKLLLFFPTSFIYSGVFAESTTLLFIILTFYVSRLNDHIKSGFFSALALLTKSSGVLSMIALIPKNINGLKLNRLLISFLIPATAFLFFLLYHHIVSGNAFIYFETAANGWAVKFINPFQMLGMLIIAQVPTIFELNINITIAFIFLQTCMLLLAFKRVPLNYWFFWLFTLLLPLSSGSAAAISIPRHTLLSFPLYLAISLFSQNKILNFLITVIFLIVQVLLMALWVNGTAII